MKKIEKRIKVSIIVMALCFGLIIHCYAKESEFIKYIKTNYIGSKQWGSGYNTFCFKFIKAMSGISLSIGSAIEAYEYLNKKGVVHQDYENMPINSVIWYDADSTNGNYGHTGFYAGNNNVISITQNGVQETDFQWKYFAPILGYTTPNDYIRCGSETGIGKARDEFNLNNIVNIIDPPIEEPINNPPDFNSDESRGYYSYDRNAMLWGVVSRCDTQFSTFINDNVCLQIGPIYNNNNNDSYSYEWFLGDHSVLNGQQINYSYNSSGLFTAWCYFRNDSGAWNKMGFGVYVKSNLICEPTISTFVGEGGGISSDTSLINCNDNVTYTITPLKEYLIKNIMIDGVSYGAVTTINFLNVTLDHSILASFILDSGNFNIIPGDVNKDGIVDFIDFKLLLQIIRNPGMEIHNYNSDVNQDGIVNFSDLIKLYYILYY